MLRQLFAQAKSDNYASLCPLLHPDSDEEGPFRFECDDLEVKLSPRSREREASNIASDATFDNLVMEVCQYMSVL